MRLTIRLFSILKERVGRARVDIEVPEGISAGNLLAALAVEHPAIREMKDSIRLAVNDSYVRNDHGVVPGDDVALLTPVSGG